MESYRRTLLPAALALLLGPSLGRSHGHMTYPPSTRHGGSLSFGGDCERSNGACYWFTNNQPISGEPTLNSAAVRSVNVNISSGSRDWSRKNPWRAPGSAPVLGSGCGSAGGGPVVYANGGTPPENVAQGTDGTTLPKQTPVVWPRGSVQDVGMAVSANHAGGYAWRLCKDNGNVNEACFQQTHLRFAEDKQYIVHADGKWSEIPLVKVTEGTRPAGSEWARFPVPSCLSCNPADTCGDPLPPVSGSNYFTPWNEQVNCNAACAGSGSSKAGGTCPGATQFEEPIPSLSGFGKSIWDWSVVDRVMVPADLEPGDYLLSWRWDCEQSDQVFQNCADVRIAIDDTDNAQSRVTMDPLKQTSTYEALGRDGCEDKMYEKCDDKGTDNKDGFSQEQQRCLDLGVQGCSADAACTWYTKGGKKYCWVADGNTKGDSSSAVSLGARRGWPTWREAASLCIPWLALLLASAGR